MNAETTESLSLKNPIPKCLYGYFTEGNKEALCTYCEGQDDYDPNSFYYNPGYYVNSNNTECKKCP